MDPDGVAMMSPSPWTVVTNPSSQKQSRCVSAAESPRSITTSFRTTCSSQGGGSAAGAEEEEGRRGPPGVGRGARMTVQMRRWRRVMWKPPCGGR